MEHSVGGVKIDMTDPAEQIFHPLMDATLPSVDDLRKRCCDEESIALLDTACHLASYRLQRFNELKANHDNYSEEFGELTDLKFDDNEILSINEADLIRAFLACKVQFLEEYLFIPPTERHIVGSAYLPSEALKESASHWESINKTYQSKKLPTLITTRLARRWALLILANPDLKIDIHTLLVSILEHIPPDWNKAYTEGLFTSAEVLAKSRVNYEEKTFASKNRRLQNFPSIPPSFFDRHGLALKAKVLLQNNPGFFVVGENDVLRGNIVKGLTTRYSNSRFLFELGEYTRLGNYCSSRYSNENELSEKTPNPSVYISQGNIPHGVGSPAWVFNEKNDFRELQDNTTLKMFKQLTALEKGNNFNLHFVISMTAIELQRLEALVPEIKSIPVLKVPVVDDKDLIPHFLSHLPNILDKTNCSIPFGLLLDYLYQTSKSNSGFHSIASVENFYTLLNPDIEEFGLLPSPLINERFFAILDRGPIYRIRRKVLSRILHESKPFSEKYIGGVDELEKLGHIYETQTKLCTH